MKSNSSSQYQFMSVPIPVPIVNGKDNNNNSNDEQQELKDIKNYIILTSIKLEKENRENLNKIKELEKIITIKEEEEDKNDNRMRYIKGLMQNLVLIKDFYIQQNQKWKNLNKVYDEFNNNILKFNRKSCIYVSLFNLILFAYRFQYFDSYFYSSLYIISLSSLIIYVSFKLQIVFSSILDFNNKFKLEKSEIVLKIKKEVEECNKLEKETISLDNWINEI